MARSDTSVPSGTLAHSKRLAPSTCLARLHSMLPLRVMARSMCQVHLRPMARSCCLVLSCNVARSRTSVLYQNVARSCEWVLLYDMAVAGGGRNPRHTSATARFSTFSAPPSRGGGRIVYSTDSAGRCDYSDKKLPRPWNWRPPVNLLRPREVFPLSITRFEAAKSAQASNFRVQSD